MIWFLLPTALAAPRVTFVDAPLLPGRATWVELADDAPGATPRDLVVRGGAARSWVAVRPGVWRALVVPAIGADAVEVQVGGEVARATLAAPAPPVMSLPDLFDALAGVDALEIPIGGWAGAPEELQVDVSEGRATIERVEQGLVVVLRPEALVHPRWILVAVRDRRSESAPVVARVRVRSRPRLPLQVEPGVTLSLEVGGRQYGPFVASETGSIDGRVDQYPGEGAATAVLTDRLGNTTRTEIPLVVDGEPTLVGSSGLELLPGRPPPTFHVAAVQAGGGWSADAPTCRAPFGAVPVRQEAPGTWFGALPALVEPQDLRVLCTLGGRQAVIRIPVAPVPARLSLRVWPQDLRADFPTAEVRVALEDWRGERLPVDRVSLSAVRGHVEPLGGGGVVGLAEYDGATAVAAGRDTVTATYRPPPGVGPVVEVELSWSAVSAAGVTLGARALDARRRPVAGAALRLWAGGDAQDVVTDGDGAASAVLAHDTSDGPVTVGADWTEGGARVRSQRGLLLPREGAGGTSSAHLVATAELSLRPGRVAGLDVDVDPPLLRAGPGATAWVVVRMEDGLGQPVTDEPVDLVVSEGEVGDLQLRPDGSLVAEYSPLPTTERREVEITASTSTVHSSARLVLEPKVVRSSLGPWIGATTRFGPGLIPSGGVDLDTRLRNRLVGEALIVRVGVSVTPTVQSVPTGVGPAVEVRSTLIPGSAALLLRDDRGPWALWGGVGVAAGLQHLRVRFGPREVARGDTWVFGPELHAAVARRALGGELVVGLRGTWLQAPTTDVGFGGNLGGVSATIGYRVVW